MLLLFDNRERITYKIVILFVIHLLIIFPHVWSNHWSVHCHATDGKKEGITKHSWMQFVTWNAFTARQHFANFQNSGRDSGEYACMNLRRESKEWRNKVNAFRRSRSFQKWSKREKEDAPSPQLIYILDTDTLCIWVEVFRFPFEISWTSLYDTQFFFVCIFSLFLLNSFLK